MKKLILKKIRSWCEEGVRFPYLHDPVSGKPSVTLIFPYISFIVAIISVISLHFHSDRLLATITAISVWVIATVFYMLRKISKAKFDLSDKSFELDSGDSADTPKASSGPTPDDLTGN